MANQATVYDLSGRSTRIQWYPKGTGGPVTKPPSTGPVLHYSGGSLDVSVSGDDLQVSSSRAGTWVTAIVKKTGIVPGAITCFSVLVPDASVDSGQHVAIQTIGVLSIHREVSLLGPGQLETYTSVALAGSAAILQMPAAGSGVAAAG
jgi:hypothetical protein